MDRDQLVAELERFLQYASGPDADSAAVLDPAGLDLADQLIAVAESSDVQAAYLIGLLHWLRYQMLPEGEDGNDLHAAVSIFAKLLPVDANLVPEPLRAELADASPGGGVAPEADAYPAALNEAALRLLQDPHVAVDPAALDEAVEQLHRAVAATSADHPDRAMYLSNLGSAFRVRYERTGAFADLDPMPRSVN